jgi:murein DD-endopeptidase MepM/ murein hydrolase activator NlpD
MFLKGVWFIIAVVLLLGQTPALAEPYTVCKNGVIYYYFKSPKGTHPGQSGKNIPKPRGEVWIEVPSARQKPPISSVKEPIRPESKVKPAAVPPLDAPAPLPLMPETAEDLQVGNPYDGKRMILAGTDYLLGLLTKLGCRYPLAVPAYAGLQPVGRHAEVPAVQPPQIVVPEGWTKLLKYAQEQPAALGQMIPGDFLTGASGLRYSFPVAGSFSFRDTWGEARSGGRIHRAVDIFAPEGTGVYAITTGVIATLATLPGAGITLFLQGQDGRGYGYMHLQGYAAGLVEGKMVRTGELIGYVGRTGVQTSAAHLHFQVYADHRLGKDELLNPYGFLIQLCHGIGVTDLNQPKMARLADPETRVKGIQVYRRPKSAALRGGVSQFSVKDSSVLIIKNY